MTQRIPRTPFATRLSGDAKETELRIRSIFRWKKKRPPVWLFTLIVVAVLGCFTLVACREQNQPPENKSSADEVLVLHTSGGREITVGMDLEPTAQNENYYMVTQLRVEEDERILQTIDPAELTATHNIEGLYLLHGYDVGEPDVRDFNFDGYEDLALLAESTIPQNPSYIFFLWSKEKRGLEASFVMTGLPELDEQQKQITEKLSNGRRRYYDWQAGWLRENPAPRQTMDLLEQIGEPFAQFADMEIQTVNIPDACGLCKGDEQSSVSYYFFGTQGLPGLAELTEEYSRRLSCAGIVSTVGEVFPQITEGMPLNWFCDALEITDYNYGYEEAPDQGWLSFSWDEYTVWIDTDNPFAEIYDSSSVIVEPDDKILIINEEIENRNILIQYEFWRGEPVVKPQVVNGIASVTEASPLSALSSTQRNRLANLLAAELPKQAADLHNLYPADLWRELLIPIAFDETEDVTIYGVVDLLERPTDDRVALDTREMEPYGIVIRKGDRAVYHSLYWGLNLWNAKNPELYVGDFDGDGDAEAALNLWVGRGTGCSVHQLCIFELDDLSCSVPDYSTLNIGVRYDDASGKATLTSGVCTLTVEVPEQFRIFDSVYCGTEVSFSCEDGQLYMDAGLDFYQTLAYLAHVKVPIVYENGMYRLGEVESLTETQY